MRARAERPLSRLRFTDGSLGWLVTGYAEARQVLADPRFSARLDLAGSAIRRNAPDAGPPGAFLFMDPPDHTRCRKPLTGRFTVRRMRLLEPRIAETVEATLTAMERGGPPADLVTQFALPVASQVICALLGVPYAGHEAFERQSLDMVDPTKDEAERAAAGEAMFQMLHALVRHKRAEPADDLLSGLTGSDLDDVELTGIAMVLLFAGHETSANMLALGTFALLRHPDQLAALRAGESDVDDVDGAVEELLRHLSIVQYEVNRAALADVEVAGETISAGESVLVSLPLANRDGDRFPDPDELDLTRATGGHLAFGHGVHQCLGQQLARIELRLGCTTLLRRFPDLRLAIPAEEVPLRTGRGIYGVDRLPVAW
ncbi:MAG: cytochrome P450 [Actinophytocola sp.]|uniref:cytochrome P450 n=1 Tax=Actinophytocola sp. TaxID=1872138 RepID=UPI00132C0501|nr:cytochrome P450 [Actinophytocola sp.]MPZ81838.1 cytochrome P450 [Actinophytocola sp.]